MITYRQAGVDIDEGDRLVERIKPHARRTRIPEVLSDVGGFAGLCRLPPNLQDPILVSGTDGVGTKLKVAFATGKHDTIGIDLVAMCVNDVITVGARPLFFLDYFATGKLDANIGEQVVSGIAEGCVRAGCALLGGETAELPGMYIDGEYDLAGFCVGVVEKHRMLGPERVVAGDSLIAVASSGLHSNGYSLARRVIEPAASGDWNAKAPGSSMSFGSWLLEPTIIYAKTVESLISELGPTLHALSHITGGGLGGNIPRVLPEHLAAEIHLGSYERPAVFSFIQAHGPVEEDEMRRTFNLGVGLVVVVAKGSEASAIRALESTGQRAWVFGQVVEQPAPEEGVFFR